MRDELPEKSIQVLQDAEVKEVSARVRLETAKEIQKIAKGMIKKNDEGEEGQNAYYAQGLHEGYENGLIILHDVIEKRFLSLKPQSSEEK